MQPVVASVEAMRHSDYVEKVQAYAHLWSQVVGLLGEPKLPFRTPDPEQPVGISVPVSRARGIFWIAFRNGRAGLEYTFNQSGGGWRQLHDAARFREELRKEAGW